MPEQDQKWHLSKSVPLSLIAAIVVQTVVLTVWLTTMRADVNMNSERLVRSEVKIETLEDIVQDQAVTLGRIDENLKAIRNLIEGIRDGQR